MTRPSVGQIDAGSVTSTPLYFGPDDASLFGVLSVPRSRKVRVGVLVCASLGKEQAETTRWFKYFAERLAARELSLIHISEPTRPY